MPSCETLKITCPCGYQGSVNRSYAGKAIRCRECGSRLQVPKPKVGGFQPKSARRAQSQLGMPDQEFALHSTTGLVLAALMALGVAALCWASALSNMPLMDRSFFIPLTVAILLTPVGPAFLIALRSKVVITEACLREVKFLRTRELAYAALTPAYLEFVDQELIVHAERTDLAWSEPLRMHAWACEWFIPFYEALATHKQRAGEPLPRELLLQLVDQMAAHIDGRPSGLDLAAVVRGPTAVLGSLLAQMEIDRRETELLVFFEDELGSLD